MTDAEVPHHAEARRRLAAARETGDPARVAVAEMVLGASLHEQGQVALALACFERAAAAYGRATDRSSAQMARLNEALCLSGLGRGDEAVAIYEDVARDDEHASAALRGLFDHHDRRAEVDAADAALDRLRSAHLRHSPDLVVDHDYAVASRLLDRGDHAAAAAAFQRLVDAFTARGDQQRVGDCELYRGVAHHRAGETARAEDAYVRAMSAYTVSGDPAAVESARHNLVVLRGG